jgi:hypothetical protein
MQVLVFRLLVYVQLFDTFQKYALQLRLETRPLCSVSHNRLRGLLFRATNQHHQIQFATYCLLYFNLPKTLNHYILTLKMATAMFAETLDSFQHIFGDILHSGQRGGQKSSKKNSAEYFGHFLMFNI